MDSVGIVEDGNSMREELADNELLKKDLKKLAGYITPYIPMIGLFCGGLVVAKHWYTNTPKTESTKVAIVVDGEHGENCEHCEHNE